MQLDKDADRLNKLDGRLQVPLAGLLKAVQGVEMPSTPDAQSQSAQLQKLLT